MKKNLTGSITIGLIVIAGCGVLGRWMSDSAGPTLAEVRELENATTKNSGKNGSQSQGDGSLTPDETELKGNVFLEIDIDAVMTSILDQATSEMIAGYSIDDSFLLWFTSTYGSDALAQIEQRITQGTGDVEMWYEITGDSIHVIWADYCSEVDLYADVLTNTYWKECASEDAVILNFAGDISFSEDASEQKYCATMDYLDQQKNGIKDCLSENLLSEMQSADIMMLNNEFQYSTRGTPIEGKTYTFRADPSRVELLDEMGVDIVNLANNHMYDYGEDALLDTLETLQDNGTPYVGAGENIDEAAQPAYFIANGRKIAIVAATQIERTYNYTKEATEDSAGVLKCLHPGRFIKEIEEARKVSDYVVVYVHWGTEGNNYFAQDQINLAEQFVEAGADVIIGGHTHCLQGIEYIGDCPVIYSLGDFWFTNETLDTGMVQLTFAEDGTMSFRFLPCLENDSKTTLELGTEEGARIIDFMEKISEDVSIDDDGYVTNLK